MHVHSVKMVDDIGELVDFDAIICTSLDHNGEDMKKLLTYCDESRIFIPPILGSPSSTRLGKEGF